MISMWPVSSSAALPLDKGAQHTDYDGESRRMKVTGTEGLMVFPGGSAVKFVERIAQVMRLMMTEGPVMVIDNVVALPEGMNPLFT